MSLFGGSKLGTTSATTFGTSTSTSAFSFGTATSGLLLLLFLNILILVILIKMFKEIAVRLHGHSE